MKNPLCMAFLFIFILNIWHPADMSVYITHNAI